MEKSILDKILDTLPEKELKQIIRKKCREDEIFLQSLLMHYASLVGEISKEMYMNQIEKLIGKHSDRYGFVSYSQSFELSMAMGELEKKASEEMEKGNYRTVFYIVTALLDKMGEAILDADDSSGSIGSVLSEASDQFVQLCEKKLDEEIRKECIEYGLSIMRSDNFQGWDWDYEILSAVIPLLSTPDEKEKFHTTLQHLYAGPKISEWEKKSIQCLILHFIRETQGDSAASLYMELHPENSDFREALIKKAIEQNDPHKAFELIEAGIEQDKEKAPGLVNKWLGYQLSIYLTTGDNANIVRLARYFFLEGRDEESGRDHYQLLKERIPPAEWKSYVQEMIGEITQQKHYNSFYLLTKIYIREQMWEPFLETILRDPSFYHIDYAEKYLAQIYPAEWADIYKRAVLEYMEKASSRTQYHEGCRYIKRMKKFATSTQVNELVEQLKKLYPRRRAMIEELNNIL